MSQYCCIEAGLETIKAQLEPHGFSPLGAGVTALNTMSAYLLKMACMQVVCTKACRPTCNLGVGLPMFAV